MNIKLKNLILILVTFILCMSCSSTKTIKNINSNFEVSKNTNIVIELEANSTTGYIWKMVIEQDKNIVEFIEDSYIVKNKKLVGAPGIYKYKIKAVSKGKVTVKGYYHRPWEQKDLSLIEPNAIYKITVN